LEKTSKSTNPHNLKNNELMLGKKTIFGIPSHSTIQLEDIRQALFKEKFSREEVSTALRVYPDIMPYVFSVANFFRRNTEVVIMGRPFDIDRIRNIISIFEEGFNCKLPYGSSGKIIKDNVTGREKIKFILVKRL